MKRYFYFLRSQATISLSILFVVTAFFFGVSAHAEEVVEGGDDTVILEVEQIPESSTENPEEETEEAIETENFEPMSFQVVSSTFSSDTPSCQTGTVYAKLVIPESLVAVLGSDEVVENGDWFPIFENGSGFSENEFDITLPHDIAIVRSGTTLFINIGPGIVDGYDVAVEIANSIEFVGGSIVSSEVFSGNVAIIQFETQPCEEDFCDASSGPVITSIVTETVTIDKNTTLTVTEILEMFGIVAEDQDGEGVVTIESDINPESFQEEGTQRIIITLTDDEGCVLSRTLILVVVSDSDDDDDDNGGGGGGSGCINPNGCGGGGKKKDKPQGEILGAATCSPYITTFIQMGQPNLKEDVVRLQTFLNNYMGEKLAVDGVYGPETFEAVKRFQMKEFNEILKPWYITEPTGIVRETTMRRINNIMCPELNIAMPILYCATTGNLIYPDGTVLDPDPEYILYNGKPVIKKQVILPDWILRKPEK